MTNAAAELVDYLCETRHLAHDEQIKGIYKRWPDITPDEYLVAVKIYHASEFGEPKMVRRRLPEILSASKTNLAT